MPETTLGILPAAGATFRLPRAVGQDRARQMILFGRQLDAAEALDWGLVTEVVPTEDLTARVRHWVEAASLLNPLAQRLAKEALAAADHPDRGRQRVRTAQAALYARQDKDKENES